MKASPSACLIDWPGSGTGALAGGLPAAFSGSQGQRSGSTSRTLRQRPPRPAASRNFRSGYCRSGGKRNWPNEPAAVPAPNAIGRHFSGSSFPKAPRTRLNEQPERPKPIRTPASDLQHAGSGRIGHHHEARRVKQRADAEDPHGAVSIRYGAREGLADPQRGSASRWQARTHPCPSRIPSSWGPGTARRRRAARR